VDREYTEDSEPVYIKFIKNQKKVEPMKTLYWTGVIQQAI